jgi:RHS repeat-associated protein
MTMKARVTNANGGIVGVERNGAYRQHVHDALGSTIALVDASGAVTDTYTYWPYGTVRSSTGSSENPYKFCGKWGYYEDAPGRAYVRARTLREDLGRWMTVDPLWPDETVFSYLPNPITDIDPMGLGSYTDRCGNAKEKYPSGVNWIGDCKDSRDCEWIAKAMQRLCSINLDLFLERIGQNCGNFYPPSASPAVQCFRNLCKGQQKVIFNCPGRFSQACCTPKTCACFSQGAVHLCWRRSWGNEATNCDSPNGCNFFHELMHICGLGHEREYTAGEGSRELSYIWRADNPLMDCHCFTSLSLIPGCETFAGYRRRGGLYITPKDCKRISPCPVP